MFEQDWLPGLLDENRSLEDRSHFLDVSNVVSCERTVAWTISCRLGVLWLGVLSRPRVVAVSLCIL